MTPRFCDAFNARKVVQTKKVRQRNRVVALGLKLPIQKRRYIRFDRDVQGCKRAVNGLQLVVKEILIPHHQWVPTQRLGPLQSVYSPLPKCGQPFHIRPVF